MRISLTRLLTLGLFVALAGCGGGGGDDGAGQISRTGAGADSGQTGGAGAPQAAPTTEATEATGAAPKLAFVTNGVASFWVIAEKGAMDAGAATGANVSVLMPAGGVVDQKRMLEDLVARGVDGIAVSPIDPDNQTDLIDTVAGRTNLITHDSDAPASKRLCYIGMDNYIAGRMCGELVKEALPDGGTVFIFIGRLEQDNAKRRRQGVIDELLDRSFDPSRYDASGVGTLAGEKYTILGTLTDQFDRAKGKANAEDALARHPDLDCMVGLFAYNPPLCLAALEQAGKLGEVKLVAFDEADETLQGIKDGTVYGTVVQDPYNYGFRSVEVLDALARGDRSVLPEGKVIDIPARQIRADNVEAFWADLKQKLGK
ncbi:MAG: sugar-binding protein [Planctomycetota bacterium]|jgi:ribose transport system substrate-binding protein